MRIQFLGTGDAFCSGARNQTCFLVELPNFRFLIDCGATSLKALRESNIRTNDIDAIFISHFHGDHFGGLPYFLLDAHFIEQRTRPLTIIGPPEVAHRVEALTNIAYPGLDLNTFTYKVLYQEYSDTPLSLGPIRLEAFPVIHAEEAHPYGLRISGESKTLAFSGDSGWTDVLYDIARESDLFICECNYYHTVSPTHLNYHRIKEEQPNFNSKQLILNHLGPEMLDQLDNCEISCAYDGLIITL